MFCMAMCSTSHPHHLYLSLVLVLKVKLRSVVEILISISRNINLLRTIWCNIWHGKHFFVLNGTCFLTVGGWKLQHLCFFGAWIINVSLRKTSKIHSVCQHTPRGVWTLNFKINIFLVCYNFSSFLRAAGLCNCRHSKGPTLVQSCLQPLLAQPGQ